MLYLENVGEPETSFFNQLVIMEYSHQKIWTCSTYTGCDVRERICSLWADYFMWSNQICYDMARNKTMDRSHILKEHSNLNVASLTHVFRLFKIDFCYWTKCVYLQGLQWISNQASIFKCSSIQLWESAMMDVEKTSKMMKSLSHYDNIHFNKRDWGCLPTALMNTTFCKTKSFTGL